MGQNDAMNARIHSLVLICGLAAGAAIGCRAQDKTPSGRARPLARELETCLALPEKDLDLGHAALLISKEEHPELDVAAARKTLDELGARLAQKLTQAATVADKLDALRVLLFDEEQFGLPQRDDASAFLLSEVLKHKRGNCLGLSVLCLALAERAGLKLYGVPVPSRLAGPGHLLVRYDDGKQRVNFDPTERGAAHPDESYLKLFKLRPEDAKKGYILGNASRRDVVNLLLVNLGGARVEANRAAEALPLLLRAAALKPDYALGYNNLGAARLRLGDLANAEQDYQKALRLDSRIVGAHLGLAEIALRRGNVKSAESHVLTAEALEPDNLTVKVLLANVYLQKGEHRPAIQLLKEVVKASPRDPVARSNLATAHRMGGEFVEAEAAYRAALALDPNYEAALTGLAETLRATGRGNEVKKLGGAAFKAERADVRAQMAAGRAAQEKKDWRRAQAIYEALIKAHPDCLEAVGALVDVLLAQGQTAAAERCLVEARRNYPDHAGLKGLLADVKLRSGDVRGAVQLLQDALPKAAEVEQPQLLQRLALCYQRTQDQRRALETAEKLLKRDANDSIGLHVAALACEALRDVGRAVGYYQRILKLDPNDAVARQGLARLGKR